MRHALDRTFAETSHNFKLTRAQSIMDLYITRDIDAIDQLLLLYIELLKNAPSPIHRAHTFHLLFSVAVNAQAVQIGDDLQLTAHLQREILLDVSAKLGMLLRWMLLTEKQGGRLQDIDTWPAALRVFVHVVVRNDRVDVKRYAIITPAMRTTHPYQLISSVKLS